MVAAQGRMIERIRGAAGGGWTPQIGSFGHGKGRFGYCVDIDTVPDRHTPIGASP
jgi:hypothetical protein